MPVDFFIYLFFLEVAIAANKIIIVRAIVEVVLQKDINVVRYA